MKPYTEEHRVFLSHVSCEGSLPQAKWKALKIISLCLYETIIHVGLVTNNSVHKHAQRGYSCRVRMKRLYGN